MLIYSLVSLFIWAFFLAGTALPFFVAYQIGRFADSRFRIATLRWTLPVALASIVAVWVVSSWIIFKRDCRSASDPIYFFKPNTKPSGISMRSEGDWQSFTRGKFGARTAIAEGYLLFIDEQNFPRNCAGEKQHRSEPFVPIAVSCQKYASLKSELTVQIFKERQSDYWWKPPIFTTEIQILENATGRVLAKATDLVFGGGMSGTYMRAFGGDQDFEWLSCGYASQDIAPWRPSLSTRPRVAQYSEADMKFLTKALGIEFRN